MIFLNGIGLQLRRNYRNTLILCEERMWKFKRMYILKNTKYRKRDSYSHSVSIDLWVWFLTEVIFILSWFPCKVTLIHLGPATQTLNYAILFPSDRLRRLGVWNISKDLCYRSSVIDQCHSKVLASLFFFARN